MDYEPTQRDRDAAASGYFAWCSGNPVIPSKMQSGRADDHSMVQAFARHRIAAEQRGKLEGARLALEEVSSLTLMLSEKCACEIKQDAFRAWAGIIAALDPAKIVGQV